MRITFEYSVVEVNGKLVPDTISAVGEGAVLFAQITRCVDTEKLCFVVATNDTDTDSGPHIAGKRFRLTDAVMEVLEFMGATGDLSYDPDDQL